MTDSTTSIDSLLQQANVLLAQTSQIPDEEPDYGMITIMVLCVLAIVGSSIYLLFGKTNSWNRGEFPKKLKYNKDTIIEAYICIGLQLFKRDSEKIKENVKYLAAYLNHRFGDETDYYRHEIINALRLQVTEQSVCSWLKEKMPQEERIQIIDFLVELAFFNELLTRSELIMIYRVAHTLGLTREDVDAIVGIRHNKAEEKRKSHQYMGKSLKEHSLEILGLEVHVDFDAIKTRYRELVKRFHPDLFSHMGNQELEMAHERFVAINTAYQYLEEYFFIH